MRPTASLVVKLRAKKTELRCDGPAIRQLAEKTAAFRNPRSTASCTTSERRWSLTMSDFRSSPGSPDKFIVRSTASLVVKLRAKKTELRCDGPAIRQLAEKTAAFRNPRPQHRAQHQGVGRIERAHQSVQAATIA